MTTEHFVFSADEMYLKTQRLQNAFIGNLCSRQQSGQSWVARLEADLKLLPDEWKYVWGSCCEGQLKSAITSLNTLFMICPLSLECQFLRPSQRDVGFP